MTFGNKLVKLLAVLLILQSARATVLTPSVLFDCLLGKNFDLRKHNEGKIFYFGRNLKSRSIGQSKLRK